MIPLRISYIMCIVLSCIVLVLLNRLKNKSSTDTPLERLKNGLVSYALLKCRPEDRDDFNMNYASFDGTRLPMFSGYDTVNATYTYISPLMPVKTAAIERYLRKNFDTDEKTEGFLRKFDEVMTKNAIQTDLVVEEKENELLPPEAQVQ